MDRRAFLRSSAALAGAGLAGCGGTGAGTPEYDVGMSAAAYRPAEYEVEVGATVVWRNTSSRAHTVTAYGESIPDGAAFFASGGFDSTAAARDGYANGLKGAISPGETYSHTFETAGRHDYFCIPHERAGMVGAILVR